MRPVFLALLLLPSALPAQNRRVAGTYWNQRSDTLGCCGLTELLQLNGDSTFRYYRYDNQGDYATERSSNGRYLRQGAHLYFHPETDPHSGVFSFLFTDTLELAPSGLRSRTMRPLVAGGPARATAWRPLRWAQLDSFELRWVFVSDSLSGERIVRFGRGNLLRISEKLRGGRNKAPVAGQPERAVRLSSGQVAALRRRFAAGRWWQVPDLPVAPTAPRYWLRLRAGDFTGTLSSFVPEPAFMEWLFALAGSGQQATRDHNAPPLRQH